MSSHGEAKTAVLFDIDGTLIRAGGAGRTALARGAARALGVSYEAADTAARAMDFRGRIDPRLIEELVVRLGRDPAAVDGAVQRAYLEELPGTLAAVAVEVMPGVPALIEALEARRGVVVGLLTGNVREGARLKLRACGLDRLADRPGGFGEDGADRAAVARVGVARAIEAGAAAGSVFVVGDTEHDVTAAHAAGARAIAVRTGWTSHEALAAAGPDLLVEDLSDLGGLVAWLGV